MRQEASGFYFHRLLIICGNLKAANAHHPVALLKVFIYFEHPMGTKGSIPAARLLFLL
jgi:hypothetical protein